MAVYDLAIIGSGPAGVQAALRAAGTGRRVAVVEKHTCVGGVCIHTGTIPSKTLRQAVMDLTGYTFRGLYHLNLERRPPITMKCLWERCQEVIAAEVASQERLLGNRGVEVVPGVARFLDPNTLLVHGPGPPRRLEARRILIAVGTVPEHLEWVPFDGRRVLDSDQVLSIPALPRSLAIVGGGVIGSEYASIYSLLDMQLTLVNRGSRLVSFIDEEITAELERELRGRGVALLMEKGVERIDLDGPLVRTRLDDGTVLETEALLFCAGRRGAVEGLDLAAAGLEADQRGRIPVDDRFRTRVPHIYAAGDVIGFPSLASASREQGRVAAAYALGETPRPIESLLPFGVYTIPEIAVVGPSEQQARERGMQILVGTARFGDTARGQIIGDTTGLLKLIMDAETRKILATHIIGSLASELVHLGQMAITFGATCEFFHQAVMNYPTLARAYKLASYQLMEKSGG